jgi:hypothetical protein
LQIEIFIFFLFLGNCYVKFRFEEDAEKAVVDLNNRWFDGRAVYAELSPVTDFHEACCRQYQMGYEHSLIFS